MLNEVINLQFTTVKDPLPDFIYQSLRSFSQGANTYRPQPSELIEKLSFIYKLPKEMIYLTAGADEAIQMFIHAYGEHTFAFTPTYVVYSDAKEFGKMFTEVYSIKENEFLISTAKINDASLIFLANPNNPSGFTSKEKVLDLVRNNSQAKVVIDEAYGDFANLSVINCVKDFPQMAVLGSFSKGYAMAGNRIGYIITNPEVISTVKNKAQWSNVSYLSVGAAIAALDHEEYFRDMRKSIVERRERFITFLKNNRFSFLPAKINAVVLRFRDENEGTKFYNFLCANNIISSYGNGNSNIGLNKSFVRIAIGNKSQMQILENVISKFGRKAD